MSGGSLNYLSSRIDDACDKIEEHINGVSIDECDVNYYCEENGLEKEDADYIRKHLHTKPNPYEYSNSTLEELRNALDVLRKASIYAHRVEYLFSGDDGEESFHERLREDLKKLRGK